MKINKTLLSLILLQVIAVTGLVLVMAYVIKHTHSKNVANGIGGFIKDVKESSN